MEGRRRFFVRADEADEIKKGPWKPEEDRVLISHVRKCGPRDWSSIRSKGLLQRTGKSCRLRWVNKLRPNLKSGVKFSAEEERTVIDLQAQFGNKWAKIATYLAGRTDNDVKNFWSSRQKRLARILPSSSSKSHSHKFNNTKENKVPFFSDVEAPKFISSTKVQESVKNSESCSSSPHIPDFETIRTVPLLELAYPSGFNYENIPFFNQHPHLSVPFIPQLQLDFPSPTSENQELVTRLGEPNFFDDFGLSSGSGLGTAHLPIVPSFLGPHTSSSQLISGNNVVTPDSFIDDFPPIDMFYHIEPLPSPSDWS